MIVVCIALKFNLLPSSVRTLWARQGSKNGNFYTYWFSYSLEKINVAFGNNFAHSATIATLSQFYLENKGIPFHPLENANKWPTQFHHDMVHSMTWRAVGVIYGWSQEKLFICMHIESSSLFPKKYAHIFGQGCITILQIIAGSF